MDPKDIIEGLADGAVRFVQSYLKFITLSLISPSRQITRQYYLSTRSSQKGISAISHLVLAVMIAIFVCKFPFFDVPSTGLSFDLIAHSGTNDALLPELVSAIVVTVAFDALVGVFCRHKLSTRYRAKRLSSIIVLATAPALIWSAILLRAFAALGLLTLEIQFSGLSFSSEPDRPAWEYFLAAAIGNLSLSSFIIILAAIPVAVFYRIFTPVSLYIRRTKYRRIRKYLNNRVLRSTTAIFFPFAILISISILLVPVALFAVEIGGRLEPVQVICKRESPPGASVPDVVEAQAAGYIMLKNESAEDRIVSYDEVQVQIKEPTSISSDYRDVVLSDSDNASIFLIKQGETRLFRFSSGYKVLYAYGQPSTDCGRARIREERGFGDQDWFASILAEIGL